MGSGPNTRIALEELDDEKLEKIMKIYRDLGFLCGKKPLGYDTAESIRKDLSTDGSIEFRPAPATDAHLIFMLRYGDDGRRYIHLQAQKDDRFQGIYPAHESGNYETLTEDFDRALREEFC